MNGRLLRLRRSGVRVALAVNATLAISYVVLWLTLGRDAWQTDFTTFYSVATMVRAGDGWQVYEAAALARAEAYVLAGLIEVSRPIQFINPPPVALLVTPLALLPRHLAYWSWTLLQFAMLTWSLVLARRTAAAWASTERRLLLVTIAAFPPVLITLILGTMSLLLLLCLWQVMLAFASGRQVRVGVWLAIGMLKPQLWPLLVVMLLVSRQWLALATLTVVSAAAIVVTTLALGWPIWLAWIGMTMPLLDEHSAVTAMYTLRGSLISLLGDAAMVPVSRFNWLALVGAALSVAGLWWKRHPVTEPTLAARFGLTVALGLFLSPYLYPHDSLLMVVPATLGYAIARGCLRVQPVYAGLALVSPALLVLGDSLISPSIRAAVPVLLIASLIGWLAWSVWRGLGSAERPRQADAGAEPGNSQP